MFEQRADLVLARQYPGLVVGARVSSQHLDALGTSGEHLRGDLGVMFPCRRDVHVEDRIDLGIDQQRRFQVLYLQIGRCPPCERRCEDGCREKVFVTTAPSTRSTSDCPIILR